MRSKVPEKCTAEQIQREQSVLLLFLRLIPTQKGLFFKCCNVNVALVLRVSTQSVPSVIQITGWLSSNTHTHTKHPVSQAESCFSPESSSSLLQRSLSFTGSTCVSLHSIIAVPHLTASEPPSLIPASRKH